MHTAVLLLTLLLLLLLLLDLMSTDGVAMQLDCIMMLSLFAADAPF